MRTFRDVIELWETRAALATALRAAGADVTDSAISKWWQRNRIPAELWPLVVQVGAASGHALPADGWFALRRTSGTLEAA